MRVLFNFRLQKEWKRKTNVWVRKCAGWFLWATAAALLRDAAGLYFARCRAFGAGRCVFPGAHSAPLRGLPPPYPRLGDFLKEIPQTPKNFFGASRALNTPCPKSPSSSQASRTPGRHPRYAPAQTAYNATSPRRPSSASPHTHGRRTTSNGRIPSSPPQPA